ncbi:condensation domain-containing protein [Arenibacter certesii]|uniref:Carrier domain-containing protein n=1 Tax=Arenibacter certesii TaxID=228955 RepID=A0A918MNP5_9FLAO|nr:condensation domain-containing protein [Arenibacter certesii]GGW39331.1 hypothetical protein GCM10007383_25080 [Arenibacter certesii]
METKKKSNIESILPLTEMQQVMLLHHLSNPMQDEGFLHVGFRMNGAFNMQFFQKAWERTVNRHQVLRSSVHWEKITTPVQLVRDRGEMNWTILDWTDINIEEQLLRLEKLKLAQKVSGLDIKQNPMLRFTLIKMGKEENFFLWPCHHLLLDGWSSSTIIKEVFTYYESLCNNTQPKLDTLPSLKSYYSWLKRKSKTDAANFWADYFAGYSNTNLFAQANVSNKLDRSTMENRLLTETESKNIIAKAQSNLVSVNTLMQGAWTLLLSGYFQTDNVVFGTSVSGRSNDFPNMDLLTGMFMNILPVMGTIDKRITLKDWYQNFQKRQIACLQYETIPVNDIISYISEVPIGGNMFDSLMVFENFPWKDLKCGDLKISEYGSGITSNYPITLIIVPDEKIEFKFIFKNAQIDKRTKEWIIANWNRVLKLILSDEVTQVHEVLEGIKVFEMDKSAINGIKAHAVEALSASYVAPRNEIEVQLVTIWEYLLGIDKVGIRDNYFELGGKSMMAIKMFALIENKIGVKLPPTTLLFNPTIELIGLLLEKKETTELKNWKYIVPLKITGAKKPLFCVHGGEGHVLFYKLLPTYLGAERPVYLLQPKGINGESPMHKSIEEMCADYLTEMIQVQEEGPYNIMFFCYSALAIEMALLFKGMEKQVNLIIVDSTAQNTTFIRQPDVKGRIKNYFLKMRHAPIMTLKSSVVFRYRQLLEPTYIKLTNDQTTINLAKIRKQLNDVHRNYQWKKIDSPITLILTEKEPLESREEKIRLWKYWSTSKVEVCYNTGNHLNLFEEPHIKALGAHVELHCL